MLARYWHLLGIALLLSTGTAAYAQPSAVGQLPLTPEDLEDPITPQQEHLYRVERAQKIAALDTDLFGDMVNPYTGSTQFSVTDVSIPGNNALPVEVRRRFDVDTARGRGARSRSGHVFEDWDLDLPHLRGVFAATVGWQAGPTPGVRCDQSNINLAAPPTVSGIEADDYWQGNQLYVPGTGDDEISYLDASAPDRPADGQTYRWVTKGLWYFSCLATTANGVPGDAFLARDPKGNRYWFNHVIEKLYAPLNRGTGSPLARREIVILPTRIEDRFGNWVTYTYSPTAPRNLVAIESIDGRRIDIAYETGGGPGGRIQTVTVGNRVWDYSYNALLVGASLTGVTRPDGSSYSYDFSAFHADHADFAASTCGSAPGFVYAPDFVAMITHPSGALGTFTFNYRLHGRTSVPENCWTAPFSSGDRYPLMFTSLSLTRKQIEGTGLPATMQWQWTYPTPVWGYAAACAPTCPATKTISVSQPDGSTLVQTFGIRYGQNDGLLLASEVRAPSGNTLRQVAYTHQLDPAGQLYRSRIGNPIRLYADASIGVFKPIVQEATTQQGATFTRSVDATAGVYSFDRFARVLASMSSSSLDYSRTEAATYFDQNALWVLGQPATHSVNGTIESQIDYYPNTALPQHRSEFGERRASYTYRPDGTLDTVTDGRNLQTGLNDWKRGLPQEVAYPSGTGFHRAVVDDFGLVTRITNEVGGHTDYLYDDLGRIRRIDYPQDTGTNWAPSTRVFEPQLSAEYGLPAGTWRQDISTGSYRKQTWFDALWRPILEREWDVANPTATQRFVRRTFDHRGQEIFVSYARDSVAVWTDLDTGMTRTFDALGRPVTESAQTELGVSLTAYEYVAPFETRITNPRSYETRIRYFAMGDPTTEHPARVEAAINGTPIEQSVTTISRDAWGKVLVMRRTGNGADASRSFLYDSRQRLCQLTEPESGALVMDYDAAGNLAWSAEGRTPAASCDAARAAVLPPSRITRGYHPRNWLNQVNYPETAGLPSADTFYEYWPDGAVKQVSTEGSTRRYEYNTLRALDLETVDIGQGLDRPGVSQLTNIRSFVFDWQHDAQGAVSGLVYPGANGGAAYATSFAPDALGQPSQVGGFVTATDWHPDGQSAGWTYGNGIVRTQTLNARRLPNRVREVAAGGAAVFDETQVYDPNANVINVIDGRDGAYNRLLDYDAQDRLRQANGVWGLGTFSFDGADNLLTQTIGAKSYTYAYTSQKLAGITGPGGISIPFAHDARGNVLAKGAAQYTWDTANRLVRTGDQLYRYDGHGRRTVAATVDATGQPVGASTLTIYGRDGQLLYEERAGANVPAGQIFANGFEPGATAGESVTLTYHWLGKALVARRETRGAQVGTVYLTTDVLGSVTTETTAQGAVLNRTHYQPFGVASEPRTGPGYTGHVMDPVTSLVYMQGRYYDADVGRFLSMDPVAPSAVDGSDFNRYAYARNNPYRYTDPDGHYVESPLAAC